MLFMRKCHLIPTAGQCIKFSCVCVPIIIITLAVMLNTIAISNSAGVNDLAF